MKPTKRKRFKSNYKKNIHTHSKQPNKPELETALTMIIIML